MNNLNDKYLLWLSSIILEQISPKMTRKNGHFALYQIFDLRNHRRLGM
jgi:hypothetical protein